MPEFFVLKNVAPYVGAWIETFTRRAERWSGFTSHPMWVRGLKLIETSNQIGLLSRTLCGCVD